MVSLETWVVRCQRRIAGFFPARAGAPRFAWVRGGWERRRSPCSADPGQLRGALTLPRAAGLAQSPRRSAGCSCGRPLAPGPPAPRPPRARAPTARHARGQPRRAWGSGGWGGARPRAGRGRRARVHAQRVGVLRARAPPPPQPVAPPAPPAPGARPSTSAPERPWAARARGVKSQPASDPRPARGLSR